MIQEIHQIQFEHALFALLVVLCIATVDIGAAASTVFIKPLTSAGELITAVLRRPAAGYTGLAGLFAVASIGVCLALVHSTYSDDSDDREGDS
jgi:hypothetical protein